MELLIKTSEYLLANEKMDGALFEQLCRDGFLPETDAAEAPVDEPTAPDAPDFETDFPIFLAPEHEDEPAEPDDLSE